MKRLQALLVISCFGAGLLGCGADEPTIPFRIDGGGYQTDGVYWSDYGSQPKYDQGLRFDLGGTPQQDGQPMGDGSQGGDSTPTGCQGPTGASCSTCAPDLICTAAKGGTCTKSIKLVGPASGKPVLKAVANAYVACWAKQPPQDTLCSTFDTCQMTGTLTDPMVCDWVCKQSQVADFPNVTKHDTAKMICGCAIYQKPYRPDWQVSSLVSGQQGIVCLSYDKDGDWMYFDYLYVDTCSKYPPK